MSLHPGRSSSNCLHCFNCFACSNHPCLNRLHALPFFLLVWFKACSFKNTLTFQAVSCCCDFIWKNLHSKNLGDLSLTTNPAVRLLTWLLKNRQRYKWRLASYDWKMTIKNQVEVGLWCFYLISFEPQQLPLFKPQKSLLHLLLVQYAAANIWIEAKQSVCKSPTFAVLLCLPPWNYIKFLMILLKPI